MIKLNNNIVSENNHKRLNSLSAFVKEQMADNDDVLPEWLDGKVNVFDKVTVSLRKSK